MALVKTVEMRVLADAGDAQRKLDDLDAKAKDLDGNDIKMRFRLEDGNAKAQLDEIRAKADLLGYKDVSIKVKVDGAGRAIADLAAVKHEEDKIRDVSILDRLGGLTGSLGGALGGAAGGFPGIGGAGVPGGAIGLGVLAAGVAALLPEVTALASGFAAAGAGAGAFALLAYPAVKKVETALSDLQKGKSLTSLHLTVDEKGAISGIEKLKTTFGKISTAFQPQAFRIFADGLKILNDVLPHVTPFASTFATVMDGLLKRADQAVKSKGFQQFLSQLHGIEGPALNAVGTGLGNVAAALGKLLTVMSGKDVARAINLVFAGVTGTINAVTTAVRFLMTAWDGMGIAIGNVKGAIHDVAATFDRVRHGLADSAHSWASTFDQVRHAVASAAHSIASAFDGIRHEIAAKFDGVRSAIAAKFDGAVGWLKGVAHSIASAFDTVRHDIAAKFDGIRSAVVSKFSGAIGWLVSAGRAIIQGLINGIESMLGPLEAVASKVAGVVSKIAGWLGIHSPSTVFFGYGVNIAEGLARGMESGLPRVGGASGRLAGAAVSGPAAAATGAHGYGGGGHHYEIHLHGVIDKQGAAREIHQLMLEYKRNGGRAALGLA